jgi:hypothetical protein
MAMESARTMTRSPVALAKQAMLVAERSLPAYSSPYSPKKFTQHQLFALLVLKQFFKTDYRGIVTLVTDFSELRDVLGLEGEVPDHSTLWYAEQRLQKKGR